MKSFVISALAGAAIIGMHGVTAMLGAEAAAIPATDSAPLVERQRVVIADGGCWETSTGEVRCHASKDKRQIIADGGCWETSTGEVRCSASKEKRQIIVADGGCWETSTGEVRCSADKNKRQIIADGGCWETSTGEVRCSAGKEKRQDIIVDGGCWEMSTGEVRCHAGKDKRQVNIADGGCWETSTVELLRPLLQSQKTLDFQVYGTDRNPRTEYPVGVDVFVGRMVLEKQVEHVSALSHWISLALPLAMTSGAASTGSTATLAIPPIHVRAVAPLTAGVGVPMIIAVKVVSVEHAFALLARNKLQTSPAPFVMKSKSVESVECVHIKPLLTDMADMSLCFTFYDESSRQRPNGAKRVARR
ncbi:MAG: hypothetical protein Q9169_001446 [Polycauliona sp. 2 TL-2023]